MLRSRLLFAFSLLTPLTTWAQTATPSVRTAKPGNGGAVVLESMEVTGQREKPFSTANVDLPRSADDVQPYLILDAAAIARSGAIDVQDFLRKSLTMDATRITGAQGIGIAGVGSSFDLRGLGANHTLVLINGRRTSDGNNATVGVVGSQPNLNGIPLAAIERIEVLPTSGSAIYGASAAGGVINVVLRRDYRGGELRTSYQNTFESDAPVRRVDLSYGFSLEKGRTQVTLAAGFSDQALLTYQDRPFLHAYELHRQRLEGGPAGVFTFTTAAPNIRSSPTSAVLTLKPAFGGGSIGSSATFVPLGTAPTTPAATLGATLRANAGQQNLNLPSTIQYRGGLLAEMGSAPTSKSFMASVRRQMTALLEIDAEFSFARTDSARHFSSLQLITVPTAAPSNPFSQNVSVYLASPAGLPTTTRNETRRATLGFRQKLPAEWIVQADYTWSEGRNAYYQPMNLSTNDLNADLLSGRLNPFVDTALHPVDLSPYFGDRRWAGTGALHNAAVRGTGPIANLPGGRAMLAAGVDWREETTEDGRQTLAFPGFPARNTETLFLGKTQSTRGVYAELTVPLIGEKNARPLLRKLDLQLAGRFEDYEVETGTASIAVLPVPATAPTILRNAARYRSTQPTVGFRLEPVRGVMLRASYSGGFIPPTYAQLLRNPIPSTTLTTINDPRRGNSARSVPTLSGGNPALTPETAKSWNAGLVFSPTFAPGLRLSADYYRIEKQDNIGTLAAQILIDNETLFPGRITRDPVPPGDSFGVGPITLVDTSSLNLLKALNEGVDLGISYRRKTAASGEIHLNVTNTFALHYKRQTVFGAPFVDWVNTSGSAPLKFRSAGSLIWDRGAWTLGWSANYNGRYKVLAPPVTTNTSALVRQGGLYVSSQIYHNAFVSYRFNAKPGARRVGDSLMRGLELQVGLENIFDKVPPYEGNSPNGFTYSTWGSLRLREYRVALKKTF